MSWRVLPGAWTSLVPTHASPRALPAFFGTPVDSWDYGAISDPIATQHDAVIRVHAASINGQIGIALVSEDCSSLVGEDQKVIRPSDGAVVLELKLQATDGAARVLVRNFDDHGRCGEVLIGSAFLIHRQHG